MRLFVGTDRSLQDGHQRGGGRHRGPVLRGLLHLLRPEAPQRPELQGEPAQEAADGARTGARGARRQVRVPGLHGPAGGAAVLLAGGADGRVVLGAGRRGTRRRASGQRGGRVRTAHRTAQRAAAHVAGARVRAAHQEVAGTGQEPDEAAATGGRRRRRSRHQRAGRVRRRVMFLTHSVPKCGIVVAANNPSSPPHIVHYTQRDTLYYINTY